MKRIASAGLCLALLACTHAGVVGRPRASASRSPAHRRALPAYARGDFVFTVKGDWGAGSAGQYDVTRRMCALRARYPFTDVLTVGDNFYTPDGVATQANFYRPEACLLRAGVVWHATWGNHDGAGSSTATLLGARTPWYAWSSHGVDFFALDTEQDTNPQQTRWLRAHLAASRARVKIAYFHKPPYTVGSVHDPEAPVARDWVPLFERFGVTLVLSGHEHDYEHLRVNGIDYVVTGGGGGVLYGCARRVPHLLRCADTYEFLLVLVRGTTVVVTAIDGAGTVLDRFSIAA